jgi:hypothetical protein
VGSEKSPPAAAAPASLSAEAERAALLARPSAAANRSPAGAHEVTAIQAMAAGAEGRLQGSVVSDMALEKSWQKWGGGEEAAGRPQPPPVADAGRRKPRPVRL